MPVFNYQHNKSDIQNQDNVITPKNRKPTSSNNLLHPQSMNHMNNLNHKIIEKSEIKANPYIDRNTSANSINKQGVNRYMSNKELISRSINKR